MAALLRKMPKRIPAPMELIDQRKVFARLSLFFLLFLIIVLPVYTQQGVMLAVETSRLERLASGSGGAAERRNAFMNLIRLYQLLGSSEDAIKTSERALSAFPGDDSFLLEQGRLLVSIGEYERAAQAFNALRGSADRELVKQGRLLSAKLEAFRSSPLALSALADDPDFAEHRSDIYFTLWKITSLASWRNKLAAEFPQSPEARLAAGTVNLNPSPLWLLFPGRNSVDLAAAPPVQTAVAPVTPPPVVAPQTAPVPPSAAESYLQTGLFGREENARALADRLQRAGFQPQIDRRVVNGNNFWAVIVSGGADLNATIKRLKDAGFESFPVKRS